MYPGLPTADCQLKNMSSILKDKKIILGVTGSIAAYKAAFLVRLLVKAGAEVQVLMTPAAAEFISPLTLSTLSKKAVFNSVASESGWNNHVELGLWADAFLLAPLTANTMAKLANGICDNMVAAVYLSARCPVFFAPAMDLDMWRHPATRANLQRLLSAGAHLIPVGYGELASGLTGEGRMAEPEEIVHLLADYFEKGASLAGIRLLITAGPTFEPIDPVRFVGNHSSGKMGIAIAEEAARRGAYVELVLGPTPLKATHPNIRTTPVQTAEEMYSAASALFPDCRAAILAAAVADYRPALVATEKIKKKSDTLTLEMVKTRDIAAELGKIKRPDQVIAGFALETQNGEVNAKEKLQKKNFDFIVLNSLRDPGAGFQYDTNKISILRRDNKILEFELKTKMEAAGDILDELQGRLSAAK